MEKKLITKGYIEWIIFGKKSDKAIIAALKKNHINFINDTDDFGKNLNIKIYNYDDWEGGNAFIRIYKSPQRKEYIVQQWKHYKTKYTGLPGMFSGGLSSYM